MENKQGNDKDLAIELESKKVNVCKRNLMIRFGKGIVRQALPSIIDRRELVIGVAQLSGTT